MASDSGEYEYETAVQRKLDSTMPWIGVYVAAASAACTLAMAADALSGLRSKKYWLPCKYFSLNAFSLTLLAVTMKLPLDLTSIDLDVNDKLARISSLLFMSTTMGNFMTCLGSMENNEILLSIAALGILVLTIVGNVCIHIVQMRSFDDVRFMLGEQATSSVIMLLLLALSCSLAMMVPSANRYIELKYRELHKTVSKRQVEWGEFTVDELLVLVRGYWVMAESGSPQFVVSRSAISSASGLLCLMVALTLVEARSLTLVEAPVRLCTLHYRRSKSDYGWSIDWILYIQCSGVVLGTIAPLLRWFTASWFKMSELGPKSFKDGMKIEKYWTSRMVEWRDRSLPFQIQNRMCKKLLRDAVRVLVNFCIGVQVLFVSAEKLILFLSAAFGSAVFRCFSRNSKGPESRGTMGSRSMDGTELDFSLYVLLLEGEAQLPDNILKNICSEVDRLIQRCENKQPKSLIRLLKKSANFDRVGQFDSNEVPSLHSPEPPNCWSLPLVTLMSISIAINKIGDDKAHQLLASFSEGLSIVKLIEKTLDSNGELESIRKAADVVWVGVEVYKKWEDRDLESVTVRGTTFRETLQNLSDIAEKIVTDFVTQTKDILMQNPLNWPSRVIAANSMYRNTETILLGMKNGKHKTDEELFESLSITISNILAACLTNLARVITLKCHRNNVKERQESVGRAAVLLGESREILEILQQLEFPCLDVEKAANIDEWRASMARDIENPSASTEIVS